MADEEVKAMESCANCGRAIGKLETPYLHTDHIVCAECKARLTSDATSIAVPKSPLDELATHVSPRLPLTLEEFAREQARAFRGTAPRRRCPMCGSYMPPTRKRKGSVVLALLLTLLAFFPGLLYAALCCRVVMACPDCGYKYGDIA